MDPLRILTLDSGNSRLKVSLYIDGVRQAALSSAECSFADVVTLCDGVAPDGVAACVVGKPVPEALVDALKRWCGRAPLILSPETPLPITVEYESRQTLGADRVAAAAGAAALFPEQNILIADVGTALTLDILDSTATFRGGNISPGVSLRFRALNEFTSALPLVEADGAVPLFGYDTKSAIRSGVLRGISAEIYGSWRDARAQYDASRLILSGGDARTVAPLVLHYVPFPSIVPDLVELGLVSIFKYNISL